MRTYSTKQAAKMAGIYSIVFHPGLSARQGSGGADDRMGRAKLWRWTDTDVERGSEVQAGKLSQDRGLRQSASNQLPRWR